MNWPKQFYKFNILSGRMGPLVPRNLIKRVVQRNIQYRAKLKSPSNFFGIETFRIFLTKGSRFNLFPILQRNGCWKSPKDPSYIFRHNETVQSAHFLIPKIHVAEESPFNFLIFYMKIDVKEFQRLYILGFLGPVEKNTWNWSPCAIFEL